MEVINEKTTKLKQAMITEAQKVVENYISDVVIDFACISLLESREQLTGILYYVLRKNGTNLCTTLDELNTCIKITGFEKIFKIDLDKYNEFNTNDHYSDITKNGIMIRLIKD